MQLHESEAVFMCVWVWCPRGRMCSGGINCMGVWVTEPTCVGVRKHIWRVSCGPGVFGNSLQSTASVDFIILIAKCENISKAHIYTLQKHGGATRSGIRPKPLPHNRWPIPHACTLPWDRCLHVWSLVITASANYLETRRHRQRGYDGWVFDNYRTFDETSARSTPNKIKSQMTAHKKHQCSKTSKKGMFVARWQVWKDVVSQLLGCHVSFKVWVQHFLFCRKPSVVFLYIFKNQ